MFNKAIWRISTPFGLPVEPDVKRIMAFSDAWAGGKSSGSASESIGVAPFSKQIGHKAVGEVSSQMSGSKSLVVKTVLTLASPSIYARRCFGKPGSRGT